MTIGRARRPGARQPDPRRSGRILGRRELDRQRAGVFDQLQLRRPLAATDLDPAVLEGAAIDAGALGEAESR